jgi:hypothetical protein
MKAARFLAAIVLTARPVRPDGGHQTPPSASHRRPVVPAGPACVGGGTDCRKEEPRFPSRGPPVSPARLRRSLSLRDVGICLPSDDARGPRAAGHVGRPRIMGARCFRWPLPRTRIRRRVSGLRDEGPDLQVVRVAADVPWDYRRPWAGRQKRVGPDSTPGPTLSLNSGRSRPCRDRACQPMSGSSPLAWRAILQANSARAYP